VVGASGFSLTPSSAEVKNEWSCVLITDQPRGLVVRVSDY
jgi:hypothetical protein